MDYNTLVSAMSKFVKCYIPSQDHTTLYDQLVTKSNLASYIYDYLIRRDSDFTREKEKWDKVIGTENNVDDIQNAFSTIYCVTNSIKLRSFQYRLMQNALILNTHLYRWGMIKDNMCNFCGDHKESVVHLFVECDVSKDIWSGVHTSFESMPNVVTNNSAKDILWNRIHPNAMHCANTICLIVKQYLYRKRCLKQMPNVIEVVNCIKTIQTIEKYNAIRNGHLSKHLSKWTCSLSWKS